MSLFLSFVSYDIFYDKISMRTTQTPQVGRYRYMYVCFGATYRDNRRKLDNAKVVSFVEFCEDGLHGFTQLNDLAVHHGAGGVQNEDYELVQRRQFRRREEMHEVAVIYLQNVNKIHTIKMQKSSTQVLKL